MKKATHPGQERVSATTNTLWPIKKLRKRSEEKKMVHGSPTAKTWCAMNIYIYIPLRMFPPFFKILFQAQDIVRTLEAEAKVVEHNLSRVGYIKYTQKVCTYSMLNFLRKVPPPP